MRLKKVAEEPKVNYTDLARELYTINTQKKALEKREKELKAIVQEYLYKQQVDAKKNAYLAFTDSSGKLCYVKHEARQSASINTERAKEYFARKNLLDVVYKEEIHYYFDEEEISMLVSEGTVPFEDLESITDRTLNYAVKFTKSKDEAE